MLSRHVLDSITVMNFLDLPAEIRLKIYENLLVVPESIALEMTWSPLHPVFKRYRPGLARQFYAQIRECGVKPVHCFTLATALI